LPSSGCRTIFRPFNERLGAGTLGRRGLGDNQAWRGVIVVPCFNEARRLDEAGFLAFAVEPRLSLLFVDDGSTDRTLAVLEQLAANLKARGVPAETLALERNQGKGEAVRRGMVEALRGDADVVGYFDADLATPPVEMVRLVRTLLDRSVDVAIAARVALLGRRIVRKAYRHYLGRVFATAASLLLDLTVYDTQCGAKAFRRTKALEAALGRPFSARWAFDVELIGRLLAGVPGAPGIPVASFLEMPLREWRDVGGSTLRPAAFPRLALELLHISRALHAWRRREACPA
jgi:dolichyl-phosphate beta-glucosyltransferase